MFIWILTFIVVLILCLAKPVDNSSTIKKPKGGSSSSDTLTGLPWMGGKKKKKDSIWDD